MQEALFCQALGLAEPWAVERVALGVARSRIDLYIVWRASSAACPACSAAEQKLHDHRQRSWRHLDFFQFEAYVHCELPRIACSVCQATMTTVSYKGAAGWPGRPGLQGQHAKAGCHTGVTRPGDA